MFPRISARATERVPRLSLTPASSRRETTVCAFFSFGLAPVSPSVARCAFVAERSQRASKTRPARRGTHTDHRVSEGFAWTADSEAKNETTERQRQLEPAAKWRGTNNATAKTDPTVGRCIISLSRTVCVYARLRRTRHIPSFSHRHVSRSHPVGHTPLFLVAEQ